MCKKKKIFTTFVVVFVFVCFTGMVPGNDKAKVADVSIGSFGIHWQPKVPYASIMLSVSCPDGQVFRKTFTSGTTPYLSLSDNDGHFPDGSYTYELRIYPYVDKQDQKSREKSRLPEAPTQTGYFTIRGGSIVVVSGPEREPGIPQTTFTDDVIIQGKLCAGTDCTEIETFGVNVQKLKANNLGLLFEDSSTTSSFPTTDWRIFTNDTNDGGGSYFAIQDYDENSVPFTIEATAPDNSLYVAADGDIGISTATPSAKVHIIDGNTLTIRMEQDNSCGETPQTWDICGNDGQFYIQDTTNSKIPFSIKPNSPAGSIVINTGGVGFGTSYPLTPLELETTGEHATFIAERTDGATAQISARANKTMIGSRSNHNMNFCVNNDAKMTLDTSGYLGIGTTSPSYPLELGNANNAYCSAGGVWTNGSCRAAKENIKDLTAAAALAALEELNPVTFNYRVDKEDNCVGFIAEDVPELVAAKDRKGISAMDVAAVLTKVVQEQQKLVKEQQQTIEELKKEISELKKSLPAKKK